MTVSDILRKLDAYPKSSEDIRQFFQGTVSGATVTILSSITIAILCFLEILAFLSPNLSEELFVDTTRTQTLRINLDITISSVSCDYLTLDAMDSAGDQHFHIDHNIFKRRLHLNGDPIEEHPVKQEISTVSSAKQNLTDLTISKCGSCYGAEYNKTSCCNTCDEVIAAYHEKRWQPNPESFAQCREKRVMEKAAERHALKEGCQVYGHIEVNRMGGSFHIAPGKSFPLNHIHVHDVTPYTSSEFNLTHAINHLSFGDTIHSLASTHPLDGMSHVAGKDGMFIYYIKIVPTLYVKKDGKSINTNQFSVTRHQKKVASMAESGMPGLLLFNYELSPLMVKYAEKERSLGHLATNICSIVGGVFTVAGIIVALLNNSLDALKKSELGKQS